MGYYDIVRLEESVELPGFPDELDETALQWQTKDIGYPSGVTYKLTGDGRLLRKEHKYREKTPDEKSREAAEHGFDSWDAYESAVRERAFEETEGLPAFVSETVAEDEWWANHNHHGTFEFHTASPSESQYDIYWSYEARFTRGNLDEIVFLGERNGDDPDELELG